MEVRVLQRYAPADVDTAVWWASDRAVTAEVFGALGNIGQANSALVVRGDSASVTSDLDE
jgi:hypothetical protein